LKRIKQAAVLLLLLCMLLSLCPAAFAEQAEQTVFEDSWFEGLTWEEVMDKFMEDYGVKNGNVGIGYLNLVTGEEHYVNPDQFIVAASMYKIPINMLFTGMITDGEIDWDTSIRGYRYSYCIEATILNSSNEIAECMWNYVGGYRTYREKIAPLMGEDPETADYMFYKNNYFTAREMIYCLNELYTNSSRYPKVIDYLLQAEPNKYFRAHKHDVEIAHKYGYLDDSGHFYLNDCGIVFTEDPIALVVFTDNVHEPYKVLADYCDLMIAYTEYHTAERKRIEQEEAEAAAIAEILEKTQQTAAPAPAVVDESQSDGQDVQAVQAPEPVSMPVVSVSPAASENTDKGGTKMIIAYIFTALFFIAAVVYLIVRSVKSKINLPWALGAAAVAALAMAVCVYAVNVTPVQKDAEGNPAESVEAFFAALEDGRYEEAYSYLSGYSTLGVENAPSGEAAQLLYKLLQDSYSCKLYGESVKSGNDASQGVLFTYLDLNALKTDLRERTELEVEKLIDELEQEEIYGENDEYLDSFLEKAYVNALNDLLGSPEKYYKTSGLVITLVYKDDMWKIDPDSELNSALSGGTSY